MRKIDFTKPIRTIAEHRPRTYIGRDGEFYVIRRQDGTYYCVDEFGFCRGPGDPAMPGPFIENAPVTYDRWIVIFQMSSGEVSSATYHSIPPQKIFGQYHKVLAVKQVTIEEGEGLTT